MTKTEIAARSYPAPTPQYKQSLSPEKLAEHRVKIAFDVEIILQGYWDSQPPAQVKAGILADWADTLEDWTQEQILYALRKWRNEFPSKRPNPGHILVTLKELRGRAEVKRMPMQEPVPEIQRVSAERAAEIMAGAGFKPRIFGGDA